MALTGQARLAFGVPDLLDGIEVTTLAVGLFAIGEALHLSPKTVDTYRSRLMAKLGLSDIAALVRWAIRERRSSIGVTPKRQA